MLCGEGACAIPERFADRMDSAFALDGFEKDGADGVVEFGFEVGNVVEADKFDAGNEGREGEAIFFRGGDADERRRCGRERNFPAPGCGACAQARARSSAGVRP